MFLILIVAGVTTGVAISLVSLSASVMTYSALSFCVLLAVVSRILMYREVGRAHDVASIGYGGSSGGDLASRLLESSEGQFWFGCMLVGILSSLTIFGRSIDTLSQDFPSVFGRFRTTSIQEEIEQMNRKCQQNPQCPWR